MVSSMCIMPNPELRTQNPETRAFQAGNSGASRPTRNLPTHQSAKLRPNRPTLPPFGQLSIIQTGY